MSQRPTTPSDLVNTFQRLNMSTTSRQPTTAGAQAAAPTVKVRTPDVFHGDRDKLRAFLSQVETYFRFNRTSFTTEEDKVVFCSTYLRGSAYNWFEPTLTNFLENTLLNRKALTTAIFGSYIRFKEEIKKVYAGIDEERTAARQILMLRQTGSATEYASKFQQISSRLEWEDAALTEVFYTGLKEHVKDEISRIERPDELSEMTETAIRIDNRIYERQMERNRGRSTSFQPRYKANSGKTKKPYPGMYPREMDLDATQHRSHPRTKNGKFKPRQGKLTQAQRDERKKNDQCMYCGKPGHYAKECKAKQQLHMTLGAPEEKLPSRPPSRVDNDWNVVEEVEADGTWDASVADPSEPSESTFEIPKIPRTAEQEHACLSWTGCYDDECLVHKSDKDATGWYPKKPQKTTKAAEIRARIEASQEPREEQSLNAIFKVPQKRVPNSLKYDEDYVEMTTKFWKHANCDDPDCELGTQHCHKVYAPEEPPKAIKTKLRLRICRVEGCPDERTGQIHCHQGSSLRGASDWTEVDTPEYLAEEEQSLSMTQMSKEEQEECETKGIHGSHIHYVKAKNF